MGKYILSVSTALIFIIVSTVMEARGERKVGGLSEEKPADDSVKGLVQTLQPKLTSKIQEKSCASNAVSVCQEPPTTFEVLSYKSQIVSGTNYFVKIQSYRNNVPEYWHARIYSQPWTSTLELSDVEGPKSEGDEISYF